MHDFSPGPPPPGRSFWTVRLPAGAGAVDPVAGTASYRVTDLRTRDYIFLANALVGGPSSPATVSFDLRWNGVTRRASTVDRGNRFAVDGAETGCTMVWSARGGSGFTFSSDPASSRPAYAAVYRERNGVFLPG